MANICAVDSFEASGPINIQKREFTWYDWRTQNEPFIWDLFNNMTRMIGNSNVTMLDNLSFETFINFCQKHTSKPVEIEQEIPEDEIEQEQQQQEETESDNDILDDWYY